VESLRNPFNSLLTSEGLPNNAVHWHVRADGFMGFAICGSNVHFYQTAPAFDRDHLSQWRHLAVVCDHTAARVRMYVDGQVTDESPMETPTPIDLRLARIGHWNSGNLSDPSHVRNLNGTMDELMIFRAALATEEIRNIYKSGQYSEGR
jgi:hypothetical protein